MPVKVVASAHQIALKNKEWIESLYHKLPPNKYFCSINIDLLDTLTLSIWRQPKEVSVTNTFFFGLIKVVRTEKRTFELASVTFHHGHNLQRGKLFGTAEENVEIVKFLNEVSQRWLNLAGTAEKITILIIDHSARTL